MGGGVEFTMLEERCGIGLGLERRADDEARGILGRFHLSIQFSD